VVECDDFDMEVVVECDSGDCGMRVAEGELL
jgi:hypothetical protein